MPASKLTLSQLEQYLSKAAWILKGPIGASDFKAYIFPMLFIDAADQVRVGRAQNYLEPEHVERIFAWYRDYKDVENYVKVATMADLAENDHNLNIPLYVEKIIEDNLPTIEEALADLKTAWSESQAAEAHFKAKLKEFGVEV